MIVYASFFAVLIAGKIKWPIALILSFFPNCRMSVFLALITSYIPGVCGSYIRYDGVLLWLDGQTYLVDQTLPEDIWLWAKYTKSYNKINILAIKNLNLISTMIAEYRYCYLEKISQLSVIDDDLIYTALGFKSAKQIWYTFGIGHMMSIHAYHLYILDTKRNTSIAYQSLMLVLTSLYMLINPQDISICRIWLVCMFRFMGAWFITPIKHIELILISNSLLLLWDDQWLYSLSFWLSSLLLLLMKQYETLQVYLRSTLVGIQIMLLLYLYQQPMHIIKVFTHSLLSPLFQQVVYPITTFGLIMVMIDQTISEFLLNAVSELLLRLAYILTKSSSLLAYQLIPWQPYQALFMLILIVINWRYAILLLLWLLPISNDIPKGEVRYHLLDVGHGLSVVLTTQSHTLIYDAGSMQPSRIIRALQQLFYLEKLSAIDVLIFSHADYDHISAKQYLEQNIPITQVYTGESLFMSRQSRCQKGHVWYWDEVRFEFLHPDHTDYIKGNQSSCVLLVSSKNQQLLLTGDIDRPIEEKLVKDYPQLQADILLAAHHGSKTSSSKAWLKMLQPSIILLSAKRNKALDPILSKYRIQHAPYQGMLQ
ncbi:MBL fold metallo-hydrolase [Gammaproteobacteria bacterium]|nr:MBL fold metallo-hydrolase [Gammaproteobacteria bacterium]